MRSQKMNRIYCQMSHACTVKYAYYMNMPPQSSYLIDGEYKEGGTVIKKELISLGTHSYSLSRFIETESILL